MFDLKCRKLHFLHYYVLQQLFANIFLVIDRDIIKLRLHKSWVVVQDSLTLTL